MLKCGASTPTYITTLCTLWGAPVIRSSPFSRLTQSRFCCVIRAGSGVTSPSQTGGSLLALDPPFPPSDSFPASPLNPQGPPVTAPPGFILDNNYSVDDVHGAGQSRSRSGSFSGSPYIPYPQLPPGLVVDPDFSVGDQDNALPPEYIVDPSFSVDDQDNANSQFDMYSGSGASYWGSEFAEYGGVSVADEAAADESQSVTPFQCLECKKYYKHLESLKGHLRLHEHNRRGKSFCERCNRKYSTPAYYRYHLRTVHNEGPQTLEQGYECDKCPAKFNTSKKLKDHRQIHEGATICPTCKKFFGTVSAKNKHMKKHSGAN
ncbi:unnamed protein product [Bemisia tabaci]|uniref:C2H2-type domain-containing protein n=1 Tax=Bemisia tabaci TaxID=7038 RepID=A0A9P0C7P8_BEMTA|nr:unnamed protein product [Bemisia tabaci]